jgi:hypothetical protein
MSEPAPPHRENEQQIKLTQEMEQRFVAFMGRDFSKNKNNKLSVYMIVICLLILAGCGGGAYYWKYMRKDDGKKKRPHGALSPVRTSKEVAKTKEPNVVPKKSASGGSITVRSE